LFIFVVSVCLFLHFSALGKAGRENFASTNAYKATRTHTISAKMQLGSIKMYGSHHYTIYGLLSGIRTEGRGNFVVDVLIKYVYKPNYE
jgi:hypothetical protein